MNYSIVGMALGALFPAVGTTLRLAFAGIVLAALLGIVLATVRLLRPPVLHGLVGAYIELFRNTPLILQMFVVYFGLPLVGFRLSGFACGVLGLALQHAAFLAVLFQSAIESVPKGQWEGARALGMRRRVVLRKVILPQALRASTPALTSAVIVIVKDTSLVAGIGVMDLTLTGKVLLERTAASFEIFVAIALIYLAMTVVVAGIGGLLEVRMRSRA